MLLDERPALSPPDVARGEPPALPAEYALIGLIVLEGGESHGYALAQHFVPGEPLASILGLEPALIYYYLKKLARRGWVVQTRADQPSRPARQLCQITPSGQQALRDLSLIHI